jgi:hypothetical protein
MQKTWQDVAELGRDLPLEDRIAAARELLAPRENGVAEEDLVEIRRRLGEKHLYEPFRMGRRHASAGAKGTRDNRATR